MSDSPDPKGPPVSLLDAVRRGFHKTPSDLKCVEFLCMEAAQTFKDEDWQKTHEHVLNAYCLLDDVLARLEDRLKSEIVKS